MKYSVVYILTSLLNTAAVSATCVPGTRETISPGYTVEYQCGRYRQGSTTDGIASTKDCAALCEKAGVDVCSYHPPTKKCLVSRSGGADIPREGVYYMVKIDEPEEDPFKPSDPVEERDACLRREELLKAELEAAKAKRKSDPVCGVVGRGQEKYLELFYNVDGLDACKEKCLANPECQAYAGSNGKPKLCYTYDRMSKQFAQTGYQHMITQERDC